MQIKINQKSISYTIQGEGKPPVLLVHGWGGSQKSLEPLASLLSKQYKTIRIDLPGFGESDNPDAYWGVDEYASCIINFLHSLSLNQVVYFGHSFGGNLGIYLAAYHPQYISKLILCDSSYRRKAKKIFLSRFLRNIPKQPKRILYKLFFPNSDLSKYPHLESNFRRIIIHDLTHDVSKIKVPTLILWGEKDAITPIKLAHELNQHIKNSKLIIYKDAKHSLPITDPKIVYSAITEFI